MRGRGSPVALTARRGLVGALILLRRSLLVSRAAVACGAAALASSGTALRAHVRHSERRDGLIVDAAGCETLLPLERRQRADCSRAEPAVRPSDVEPFLDQDDLNLPDLLLAQVQCAGTSASGIQPRPAAGRPGRHDRNDPTAVVDDDHVVMHDEVFVPAPLRIDLDQLRTNVDHPHARRHHGSGAEREVDAIHARHVPAGEDGLLNTGALLRSQVHVAGLTGRTAAHLALLARLGLTLLSLTLLWSRGLTLLRRRLALLARSLASGVILLLALATILALLAVALLRGLTGLRLAFLALLHLVLPSRALACRLLALVLACARLLRRTLLAFALALLRLGFTLLRLSCGLPLRLAMLLRRILLALLLAATLRLASAALLVARSRGAAFHLRAALGGAAS
jgi:hypothetical protein